MLTYDYDDHHRPVSTTATGAGVDPKDASATTLLLESRSYDPAGRLTNVADAMGRAVDYTYYHDSLLDTTAVQRPDPNPSFMVEKRSYDAAGHPTTVVTAGGTITTTFTYDPAGNAITQTLDPGGLNRTTTTSYNADGTVASTQATGAASPRADRTGRLRLRPRRPCDRHQSGQHRLHTGGVDNTPVAGSTRPGHHRNRPSGLATTYTYDATGQLVTTTGASRTISVQGVQTNNVQPVTTSVVTHSATSRTAVTPTATSPPPATTQWAGSRPPPCRPTRRRAGRRSSRPPQRPTTPKASRKAAPTRSATSPPTPTTSTAGS